MTSIHTLAAACLTTAALASAQSITPNEKEKASQYLASTRANLLAATANLSQSQWTFKASADRWSIAEIVEHLALLEDFFANTLASQLLKAPAGTATAADARQFDALILAKVPDRSTKAKAPESIEPHGRWTPAESLSHFASARKETIIFLNNAPDLRAHVVAHPALGQLDGYEWILAVAAHTDRHLKQLAEVEANPNFPVN